LKKTIKNGKIIEMSIKNILIMPNKILTTKSSKVLDFDSSTKDICRDLLETALSQTNPEAAGLAAPQIGVNKRIILVRDFKVLHESDEVLVSNLIMINPKIVSKSNEFETDWESCLSIPFMYGKVKRPMTVKVSYQDENGKDFKIKAKGFLARVIQHEIDHLDGIIFDEKIIGKLITEEEYKKQIENE
jgi:peptide deformylase